MKRPRRVESLLPGVNDRGMFTGLVEAAVPVLAFEPRGTGARLVLPAPSGGGAVEGAPPWDAAVGDSIAVSGACLTVVEVGPDGRMAFDLSKETLDRTWLGDLQNHREGDRLVNLERALRVGDRLGGHMVSGHVDTVGTFTGRADAGDGGAVLTFEVPGGFERYLVDKGSVTIDGISLTVVAPRDRSFDVAVIPHTLDRTHLVSATIGDRVHLEADLVAKWVERLAVPS